MRRGMEGSGVLVVLVLGLATPVASAQTDAPEERRERLVMERFLSVLEKNPRRGTALDRVYGYHVERGTVDELIARYRGRTARSDRDGTSWLLLGLFESQRGQDAAAAAALDRKSTRLNSSHRR